MNKICIATDEEPTKRPDNKRGYAPTFLGQPYLYPCPCPCPYVMAYHYSSDWSVAKFSSSKSPLPSGTFKSASWGNASSLEETSMSNTMKPPQPLAKFGSPLNPPAAGVKSAVSSPAGWNGTPQAHWTLATEKPH